METLRCHQVGVEQMLGWAAREGWNPGLHDAATFYASDPFGFWLGAVDGQPVASLSAVSWNPDFAFIGLYIVLPEQRSRGYGWKLWQHVLHQHQGKCLALDGVVAQQANYAKSGFQLAHRSLRWQGSAGQISGNSRTFLSLSEADPEQVARLDNSVSPGDRPEYLKAWLNQPGARGFCDVKVSGLAMARPCQQGWKVGPLIAPEATLAQDLLAACCGGLAPETAIFVDVPEPNQAGQEMLRAMGFTVSFEVARMYTKPVRPHRLDQLFGITSFELG